MRALPNLLTLARLAAAPGLLVVYTLPLWRPDVWALGILVAAAATDALDGWLARRLAATSRLGAVLDPVADKALVGIALAVLLARADLFRELAIPAALILTREALVGGLREAGIRLPVSSLAKLKTVAQMLALVALFAAMAANAELQWRYLQTNPATFDAILIGAAPDPAGIRPLWVARGWLGWGGLGLIWLAALLTAVTGAQYVLKAVRELR